MEMIFFTEVFRPPPKRLAKIGDNITFSRSIPVLQLWAGVIGAISGLFLSFIFLQLPIPITNIVPDPMALLGSGFVFCFLGIFLVNWSPWEGESLKTVIWAKGKAFRSQASSICPGSLQPAYENFETGDTGCVICTLRFNISPPKQVPIHDWRRQIYVGIQPIPAPVTGVINLVPGALPAERD